MSVIVSYKHFFFFRKSNEAQKYFVYAFSLSKLSRALNIAVSVDQAITSLKIDQYYFGMIMSP